MTEPNDIFDEESLGPVVIIQLFRIYDVLIGLLMDANPDQARFLLQSHANGEFIGPQPAFKAEDLGAE